MADMTTARPRERLVEGPRAVAHVSWAGIFLGAITTIAIGILLMSLGAAIGLSRLDPAKGEWVTRGGAIGTGIWAAVSFGIASFIGAMVGVRTSSPILRRDAAAQGLGIWGLALLLLLVFFTYMAFATARVAASASEAVSASPTVTEEVRRNVAEAPAAEVAGAATEATAGAAWGFFALSLLGLIGAVLGGIAGARAPEEVTPYYEVPRPAAPGPTPTV